MVSDSSQNTSFSFIYLFICLIWLCASQRQTQKLEITELKLMWSKRFFFFFLPRRSCHVPFSLAFVCILAVALAVGGCKRYTVLNDWVEHVCYFSLSAAGPFSLSINFSLIKDDMTSGLMLLHTPLSHFPHLQSQTQPGQHGIIVVVIYSASVSGLECIQYFDWYITCLS